MQFSQKCTEKKFFFFVTKTFNAKVTFVTKRWCCCSSTFLECRWKHQVVSNRGKPEMIRVLVGRD